MNELADYPRRDGLSTAIDGFKRTDNPKRKNGYYIQFTKGSELADGVDFGIPRIFYNMIPTAIPSSRHSGLDPWFDRPFGRLTVLSKVEGLTTLSGVEGESRVFSNRSATGCRIGPALNLIGGPE